MSNETSSAQHTGTGNPGDQENLSMLFAQLVMQQANMAMMLMGRVKNPETGQEVKDLDAARFFIDELEMLEVKTKGNLNSEESALLKQTLMSLRLAFVEAVESPGATPQAAPSKPQSQAAPDSRSGAPAAGETSSPSSDPTAGEEEHKKKFTKKY